MYTFAVVTMSDKGSTGAREDTSGKWIVDYMLSKDYSLHNKILIPDDYELIKETLINLCNEGVSLILTTGGTGFSPRDITPEATKAVIEREVPGIPEAMRAFSMTVTKRAMLSRAVSGIRGNTLIVNMPGSKKAVEESLTFIVDELHHGLSILNKDAEDCARK